MKKPQRTWTEGELRNLAELRSHGRTVPQIAASLRRKVGSVKYGLRMLNGGTR